MKRPDTPFPRHWIYYILIKLLVLAGGVAFVLNYLNYW